MNYIICHILKSIMLGILGKCVIIDSSFKNYGGTHDILGSIKQIYRTN